MTDDNFIQEANRLEYIDPELLGSLLDVEMVPRLGPAHGPVHREPGQDPVCVRISAVLQGTRGAERGILAVRVPVGFLSGPRLCGATRSSGSPAANSFRRGGGIVMTNRPQVTLPSVTGPTVTARANRIRIQFDLKDPSSTSI